MPDKPALTLSRPKDRSLEAFKEWIRGMVRALGGKDTDDMTDDEWRRKWQRFWAAADTDNAPGE